MGGGYWKLGIAAALAATGVASRAQAPIVDGIDEHALTELMAAAARTDAIALGQDSWRRMTTGVTIQGRGPFPFLIDTGATRSVLSARLARAMALPAGPTLQMVDIAGISSVPSVRLARFEVGGRHFGPTVSAVVNGGDLGAPGMIGIDALAGQQVLIDVENGRMSVARAPRRERHEDPDTIVVVAKSKLGQLIVTDAMVHGVRTSVVIDTGSEISIGNMALLGRLAEKRGVKLVPTVMTGVSGQTAAAQIAQTKRVEVGPLTVENLPIAFADIEPFRKFGLDKKPAMLLGMDVIRLFRSVAIDFENRKIRFQRARTAALRRPGGAV